jgi:hypothetical protein
MKTINAKYIWARPYSKLYVGIAAENPHTGLGFSTTDHFDRQNGSYWALAVASCIKSTLKEYDMDMTYTDKYSVLISKDEDLSDITDMVVHASGRGEEKLKGN